MLPACIRLITVFFIYVNLYLRHCTISSFFLPIQYKYPNSYFISGFDDEANFLQNAAKMMLKRSFDCVHLEVYFFMFQETVDWIYNINNNLPHPRDLDMEIVVLCVYGYLIRMCC